jgi:hypothetical protein
VFGAAVEVAAEGALVLVGFAALGAALGAWAVVYDHVMCRGAVQQAPETQLRVGTICMPQGWGRRGAGALPQQRKVLAGARRPGPATC